MPLPAYTQWELCALQAPRPWCSDDLEGIGAIFKQFVKRKAASHLLDYDDILLFWQSLAQAR